MAVLFVNTSNICYKKSHERCCQRLSSTSLPIGLMKETLKILLRNHCKRAWIFVDWDRNGGLKTLVIFKDENQSVLLIWQPGNHDTTFGEAVLLQLLLPLCTNVLLQIDFSRSNNKWFWSWSKVASFLYFSRQFFTQCEPVSVGFLWSEIVNDRTNQCMTH